jgi:hypothetical protein
MILLMIENKIKIINAILPIAHDKITLDHQVNWIFSINITL